MLSAAILTLLLVIHILSGALGLLTGFAVLLVTKGERLHRRLGQGFFLAMMLLGLSGTLVGVARGIPLSALNGLLVCYLVLSGRAVFRPVFRAEEQVIGQLERLLAIMGAVLVLAYLAFAMEAYGLPDGKLGGFGSPAYLVFALVTALAVAGDVRYLRRQSISMSGLVLRHLWRMLFPLFMATAAIFLGQAKLFPEELQTSPLLKLPVVIVFGSLLYWLLRVYLTRRWRPRGEA